MTTAQRRSCLKTAPDSESASLLSRREMLQYSTGAAMLAGTLSLPQNAETATESGESGSNSTNKDPSADMQARYLRAQALEQGVFTKRVAFNTTLYPHWIEGSDSFWYVRDLDHDGGREYRVVDAKTGTNVIAFDHQSFAQALGSAVGKTIAANRLPLTDVRITLSPREVRFRAFDETWAFTTSDRSCRKIDQYPGDWNVSPDGTKAVFRRDHNLWLKDLETGDEKPLTRDGEEFYRYGASPTVYGRHEAQLNETLWSPDSRTVLTHVIDTRAVAIGMPLVEHVPAGSSLRPGIRDPERRIALPGDEQVESWEFLAIDTTSGAVSSLDLPTLPVRYPPYRGYFNAGCAWWSADAESAYFILDLDNGRRAKLVRWERQTGATRTIIDDRLRVAGALFPLSHLSTPVTPVPESNEVIWFSDRSGWPHLYLYDLTSGKLKRTLTAGNWLVRNVLHLDLQRRELWIQTAHRRARRNPYYCDICRLNIDTAVLTEVVASDDDYMVVDPASRIGFAAPLSRGVSPSGDFVVTTRSRVDKPPVSLLLRRDGIEVSTLEIADVSGLPDGWHWPEPVMLKAADGKTDVYGVIFRPTHFDEKKSYPVLDCSYTAYTPVGSFTNNLAGNWHYLSASAYAELGFIAVMISNRQHDLRDAEFSGYENRALPALNKEDCVAGIEQLLKRHPYMDSERVGVVDFGSVPAALTGMLVHPKFYKVGVSINAKADARVFASMNGRNEFEFPQYEALADKLEGKLLLMHGMLDDVMPVSMLFRVVQALLDADKRFDMCLLPKLGHSPDGVATVRAWDYVVRHLLGEQPPNEFHLTTGVDLLLAESNDEAG